MATRVPVGLRTSNFPGLSGAVTKYATTRVPSARTVSAVPPTGLLVHPFPGSRPTNTSAPQLPIGGLLTIVEVATAFGVDVRHVRRLVHERRIAYIKWGHLLRFDPREVAAWIDEHRNGPVTR
jgi:excisionase family DNA binding protein